MPLCDSSRAAPCPGRYEAIRAGVIWFSAGMRSWLCLNHLGVPTKVGSCPWCGKGMPTAVTQVERLVTMDDADFQRLQGDGGCWPGEDRG